ncbi:hypothetical protein TWF694_004560 [Orbilia ellipsospora]|uniref:F-box domain-containing protein n=1 Tax=Orbilia ellipsospora TaxID=2528407 RepID=A0AAV9WX23_9PEZI
MANIASMPYDVVHEITKLLHDPDDLLALRMTCHALSEKAKERHLTLMYQTRTIYPVLFSYQNLVKISRHPSGVNSRVKHIQFSMSTPCGQIIQSRPQWESSNASSQADGSLEIITTVAKFAKEHGESDPRTTKRLGYYNLLTSAFANLPNLETIGFSKPKRLTRSEFNLFHPTLRFGPGTRIPKVPFDVGALGIAGYSGGNKSIWKMIMFACHASGMTSLRTIQDPQTLCSIETSWFESCPMTYLAPSPPNFPLSTLQLKIYFNTDLHRRGGWCKDRSGWGREQRESDVDSVDGHDPELRHSPAWSINLCRWFGHFAGFLTELKLTDFNTATRYKIDTLFPVSCMFPMLKKLIINTIPLAFENFKAFLPQTGKNLRELEIIESGICLEQHEWFEIFKIIRDECPQVQVFKFLLDNDKGTNFGNLKLEENGHPPLYLLPNIEVIGLWGSGYSKYKIKFGSYESTEEEWVIGFKDIGKELGALGGELFWHSITEGLWRNNRILDGLIKNWRQIRVRNSEWKVSEDLESWD